MTSLFLRSKMAGEWRGLVEEYTAAASGGMQLCLSLAGDLHESERWSGCLEDVREQLLAMVKLEREVSHLKSAMEHVEAVALAVQESESPEEPPALLEDMDNKLTSLIEEDRFDPESHPSLQEFSRMLARGKGDEGGGEAEGSGDEVQVGKVQVSLKCPVTGRYLEDPVRNPECGHVYSHAAVLRHIQIQQRASGAARCPVCSGSLKGADLRPDPALAAKVRRAQRRQPKDRPSVVTL